MPAKKGTRPPNAGKRGRKPGTVNKVTRTTRELFSAFVDHNAGKAQELFDRVSRKNPAMALRILANFSDFVLPRLQRAEVDATVNAGPITEYPSFRDMDYGDAVKAYQDFIAAGREGREVRFRDPEHSEEWYKERDKQRDHERQMKLLENPKPAARPGFTSETRTPEAVPVPAAPRPLRTVRPIDPDDPTVVAEVNPEHELDALLRHQRPERVLT